MAASIQNHRRNRREIRRVLAGLRTQFRDLTGSTFREDDPLVGDRHLVMSCVLSTRVRH
jgi:hypothetical protein